MTRSFKTAILVTAIVNAIVARPGIAQTSNAAVHPAPLIPHPALQPLAFLAGSCWKGTFTGRTVIDEHCFKWIYNGRFLRDHHIVVGDSVPYEGESTYAWDAASKQIVFWYIALPGFYSHGDVTPSDSVLLFHDNLQTADARQMRTTWRRSGPDAYIVRVEEITGGTSRVWWTMEMRRSRAAP
jgi:hypothetical protein